MLNLIVVSALLLNSPEPPSPCITTSDVTLFFQIYDAAGGHPTAEDLQGKYIEGGSPAVREFVPYRIVSGEALATEILREPQVYAAARRCLSALPEVQSRLRAVFARFADLYPDAKFPPVTILVGRNNTAGTSSPSGVLIGLEKMCGTVQPGGTVADRFVHLIAHEYAHVEQSKMDTITTPNLLQRSLKEGVAELMAELTSGAVSMPEIGPWASERETTIKQRFLQELHDTKYGDWLYNGEGSREWRGDIGYWVGYRIARTYYDHMANKRLAVKDLLGGKDADAILLESRWSEYSALSATCL